MRIIAADKISSAVKELCLKADIELRPDVLAALKAALKKERGGRAGNILKAVIDNALIAREEKLAICQDTGLPCVYIELGQDARIKGDLAKAVNRGIAEGYKSGYFRRSVVADPLLRGRPAYIPGVIHTDIVPGNRVRITVLPKGFGCENKSRLKMFNPTASWRDIEDFVVESVKAAGPDACPPYVVGVGIGGTADHACLLAKKAILNGIGGRSRGPEKRLLARINKLNIGPMGLGGKTTALAVKIEKYPTHIAGLPVAVNISCHATRSAGALL